MSGERVEGGRTVGLLGATGVGVGAIVGGGILVLAGVGLEAAGPSLIVAFAINGVIAVATALSFAEMATAFPESGGAYTFAKKVLPVRAAFAVGWVLWFAYIVAGVLYALGFAEYATAGVSELISVAGGQPPPWLREQTVVRGLALAAAAAYTLALLRSASGGGQWETIGKMVLFVILILVGFIAIVWAPGGTVAQGMTPFFSGGAAGLISAMGVTFIALQGFDLIAAIGGEVKEPTRVIPRAMLYSLGIALVVYLPLVFIVATVGVPEGRQIAEVSAESPATVMADAAGRFAGPTGYWMVTGAAVLSTLSALSANVLAASRVALSMAGDRTLPRVLATMHAKRGTPLMAIYASSLALAGILLMVPDVAAAGAAASLIFLVSFALVHWTSFLARRRARVESPFPTPFFPLVPIVGGVACALLAIFQAVTVPAAGAISAIWLGLGVILYFSLFAGRARVVDAFSEAMDPSLSELRGRSPLVLVPVANPKSAAALTTVANALAPPVVGRVVLLTVVRPPGRPIGPDDELPALRDAQEVVRQAMHRSLSTGHAPEALMTIAAEPWVEIARVARARSCESLLVGLSTLEGAGGIEPLQGLLDELDCDVVVLRAPPGFALGPSVNRIVVPVGGKGGHDALRARLLGSLGRATGCPVRFVRVVPTSTPERRRAQLERELLVFAKEEAAGDPEAEVVASDDIVAAIADAASADDLLILGLQQVRGRRLFGEVALAIATRTDAAALMISRA